MTAEQKQFLSLQQKLDKREENKNAERNIERHKQKHGSQREQKFEYKRGAMIPVKRIEIDIAMSIYSRF